jgi:RND family efflux transporter MFP subunit
MRTKLLALVALIAVGVGAVFYAVGGFASSGTANTQYLTSQVTRSDVVADVAATGTVGATARYGLAFGANPRLVSSSSSAAGNGAALPVTSVAVKAGDKVKAGDVLAVGDPAPLQQQLDAATASWHVATIQLRQAKTTRSNASGTDQKRQADIGVYSATSQLAQAVQKRADLQAQLAQATISAPIDGTVVAVNIVAGFDAPSGDAILLDAATLRVSANVVESDLTSLSVGQLASVTIAAVGADLTGTVSSIAPVANTGGNSGVVDYAVTVAITDTAGTVRPGMSADVSVTTAQALAVLAVPAAALSGSSGAYAVRVIDDAGQVQARSVTVGLVTSSLVEVKTGLTEGETVVTGLASTRTTTTNAGGFGGLGGGTGGGTRIITGPQP